MNTELLLKVRDRILAEPEHFDMSVFIDRRPACGTTACIAGWALALSHNLTPEDDFSIVDSIMNVRRAGRALELSDQQEAALFWTEHWPEEFQDRYESACEDAEMAKIAAERIDHFIATEGRE